MSSDGLDGLTPQEMATLVLGTDSDQRDYLVFVLQVNNPGIPTGLLYKVAGSVNKKYGFRSCVFALRDLKDLDSSNIFPRTTFACKSYSEVELAERSLDEQSESVATQARIVELDRGLAEFKKLKSNPKEGVFKLLCSKEITLEEFELVKDSADACMETIKRVRGTP
jgi:hypothetical protein